MPSIPSVIRVTALALIASGLLLGCTLRNKHSNNATPAALPAKDEPSTTTSQPDRGTASHNPDERPVLQSFTGFTSLYGERQQIIIYPDGLAIASSDNRRQSVGEPMGYYDVAPWQLLHATKIPKEAVARIVAEASELIDLDYGSATGSLAGSLAGSVTGSVTGSVSTQGEATTTLEFAGRSLAVKALGSQEGGPTGNSAKLRLFLFDVLETAWDAEQVAMPFSGIAVTVSPYEPSGVARLETTPWPLPLEPEMLAATASGCMAYPNSDDPDVIKLANGPSAHGWSINGKPYTMTVRLLLPHEQSC
jgi:hypothetical protein